MKHSLFITLTLAGSLFFSKQLKAQDETAFDKGTVVITAGLGVPDFERLGIRAYYAIGYNNYGYASSSKVRGFGPMILKGDYCIYKFKWGHSVGAGAVIGFSPTTATTTYTDWVNTGHGNGYYATFTQKDKYTRLTIGARGSYHFFTKEKFDCYASVGLGYNINMFSRTTDDPNGYYAYTGYSPSSIYTAFTVGIRYFFTKNIGVYSELGWDMSTPIQGGLAIKF